MDLDDMYINSGISFNCGIITGANIEINIK